MKSILYILFFTVITSNAQQVEFKWSESYLSKDRVSRFLGIRNNNIYTNQYKEPKYDPQSETVVRVYDQDLKTIKEDTVRFESEERKYYAGVSFLGSNSVFHVGTRLYKSEDSVRLKTIGSDFDLSPHPKVSPVGSMTFDKYYNLFTKYSKDLSKVMVYNSYFTRKARGNVYEFKIFNPDNGELLHSGSFSFDFAVVSNESIMVDNNGSVYFVQKYTNRKREKGQSLYDYKLLVFAKNNPVKEYSLGISGYDIGTVDIIQQPNNTVLFTGFAYEMIVTDKSKVPGFMFLYSYNAATLQMSEPKTFNVTGLYPDRKLKNEDLFIYTVRDMFSTSKGGYMLVAEQYQITMTGTNASFNYNDIACIQLDKEFQFQSTVRIPKVQLGIDNPSIVSTFSNDKLYILYNDHLENKDLPITEEEVKFPANNSEKNGLLIVTVTSDGKVKKQLLYGYAENNKMPIIKACLEVKPKEIFLNTGAEVGLLKIID